ncbi:IS3 family transposase [Anoxybacillus flavithermus]|nr:IS3 family transposase [Anoxybacillus flavithermus]
MQSHVKIYPVRLMCKVLGISPQGYYDWKKRRKSQRTIDQEILEEAILQVYKEFKGRYGSPRIAVALCKRGLFTSKNRVARLMQRMGLAAVSYRKRSRIGRKPKGSGIMDNLVKRAFEAQTKNTLWVGDITYLPLQHGFLYLATYLDVFSRKVVGWAMNTRMTEVGDRRLLASRWKGTPVTGLIVHTDRGSQYTSRRYQSTLAAHGAILSMSRLGDPYDNAVMESFYKTLKRELMPETRKFTNEKEARNAVFEYIEMFYNTKRMHSALGYMSPVEYEKQHS